MTHENQLKPTLNGAPLEGFLALLLGDYAATEYLDRVVAFNRFSLPSADYYAPMHETEECFRRVVNCTEDQAELSLELMVKGKKRLKDAVLLMLDQRECQCCIAMRARLEMGKHE